MAGKRVLLIGDYPHRDFRDALAWLRAHTQLTVAAGIGDALEQLADGPPPAAMIVAQAYPARFTAREIERLHAASPVSRLVALLGTWCEGELRSGRPWPGVARVYWHQWSSRFIAELTSRTPGRPTLWSLPRTATVTDQLDQDARSDWPQGEGLIAIHTRWWTTFQSLGEACRLGGYATAWLSPAQPPQLQGVSAVVWDADAWRRGSERTLQELVARYHPARLVALLDFVRREDYDRALAVGATAVLGKPFLVPDLLVQLQAAVPAV